MNDNLKLYIDGVFDVVKVVEDEVAKPGFSMQALVDVEALGAAVPALIPAAAGCKTDLQALAGNPAADADLLAYVAGKVSGDSAKAQKIITASINLAIAGDQLAAAFQ